MHPAFLSLYFMKFSLIFTLFEFLRYLNSNKHNFSYINLLFFISYMIFFTSKFVGMKISFFHNGMTVYPRINLHMFNLILYGHAVVGVIILYIRFENDLFSTFCWFNTNDTTERLTNTFISHPKPSNNWMTFTSDFGHKKIQINPNFDFILSLHLKNVINDIQKTIVYIDFN